MLKPVILAGVILFSGGCTSIVKDRMGPQQKVGVPSHSKQHFGTLPGTGDVSEFELSNGSGVTAKILSYGGVVSELWVPDRDGTPGDIVLGFDNLLDYTEKSPYFGTITGRVANRIAKGEFTLDGVKYKLAVNNGPNHLHGGLKGFDKVLWKPIQFSSSPDEARLALQYVSPDGEEGYPGTLTVTVTYEVTKEGEFSIEYEAATTKPTPVNLTSHSYFNLGKSDDILDHNLTIYADAYTPVDDNLIPTGIIAPVEGTPFDFRSGRKIGKEIAAVPGGGYDHNFVVRTGRVGELVPVAKVVDGTSGRTMEIFSTEPGVQFYSGNFLDGSYSGKGGRRYIKHGGFCLETQHFPDAVHHGNFPSIILKPGVTFHSKTVHRFGVVR